MERQSKSSNPIIIAGIRSLGAAIVFLFYIKKPKWYWGKYFIAGIISYSLKKDSSNIANSILVSVTGESFIKNPKLAEAMGPNDISICFIGRSVWLHSNAIVDQRICNII